MEGTDDPQRVLIDRVAGISLRAPKEQYEVVGLSFGAATLQRNIDTGRWTALTLTLTPQAVLEHVKAVPQRVATVVFPLGYWMAEASGLVDVDELAVGLRELLVDHGLLSHPDWLLGALPTDLPPAQCEALERLQTVLAQVTGKSAICPVCPRPPPPRESSYGEGMDFDAGFSRMLRMMGIAMPSPSKTIAAVSAPPPVECPHAAMREEALRALGVAFPEVAFEAAQLLLAVPAMVPPRFVLSPMVLQSVLDEWLMKRAPIATASATAPPFEEDAGLKEVQRAGLAFAASAWRLHGPLVRFVPTDDDGSAPPTISATAARTEATLWWPESVPKPPPRPAAERAAPRVVRKRAKPAPTVKPAPTAKPAPGPQPGQEIMTSDLLALGYTTEKVKALITAGTLERAGYGRFRWKG